VRGIHVHAHDRDTAHAGERAALALAATSRHDLNRGDCLLDGDGWLPASIVTVRLHALRDAAPIRSRQRVRFHLATSESFGRVVLLEATSLEPGHEAWAQLRLEVPVVARAGDRFVIRSYSPVRTIGGGRIAEPSAARRKRTTPRLVENLAARIDGPIEAAIDAVAADAGFAGVRTDHLAILTTAPPHDIRRELETSSTTTTVGAFVFHREAIERAQELVLRSIDGFHDRFPLAAGIPIEELRHSLPRPANPILADATIATLSGLGLIVTEGHTVRRAAFQPHLATHQAIACDAIVRLFADAGLAAPGHDELPEPLRRRSDLADLIHFLHRAGRLVPIGPTRSLHPAVLDAAIHQLRAHVAAGAELSPSDFRDLFGISRKYLIPLLEHFDRTGITRRSGDLRRLETSTER
jgi:selenocysteine-specific elongation factor